MKSGIKPSEEMIAEFKAIKINRTEKVWILEIKSDKLDYNFRGDSSFKYEDLFDKLPTNEPRYIIYDFDYETDENPPRKTSKLIFIFWCPITCPAMKKFTYTATHSETVDLLGAIQKVLQVDDIAGLDYETVRKQLLK
jgi:cofilin